MTNVDLVQAIERVRDCRQQVLEAWHCLHTQPWSTLPGDSLSDRMRTWDIAKGRLNDANTALADCMIALQHGYDLALLPKQGETLEVSS